MVKRNLVLTTRAAGPATPLGAQAIESFQAELRRRIEQRAYELYELRGCIDGHDLDDWRAAEAQVMAESGMAKGKAA